jgi:hypothetical protein
LVHYQEHSNQSNGFGTVFVAISGLQNGAPDGLALGEQLRKCNSIFELRRCFCCYKRSNKWKMKALLLGVPEETELKQTRVVLQLKGQELNIVYLASYDGKSTYGRLTAQDNLFSFIKFRLQLPTNVVARNL